MCLLCHTSTHTYTYTYILTEESIYKFSNRIYCLSYFEISYGLAVLIIHVASCFNIKGVEFTCMAIWLPYIRQQSAHNYINH